jgi:hypothetical protein
VEFVGFDSLYSRREGRCQGDAVHLTNKLQNFSSPPSPLSIELRYAPFNREGEPNVKVVLALDTHVRFPLSMDFEHSEKFMERGLGGEENNSIF